MGTGYIIVLINLTGPHLLCFKNAVFSKKYNPFQFSREGILSFGAIFN
jgi:hypothetical protein